MARILVFGDSISHGAWDREGGWVGRLKKFLGEKSLADPDFDFEVYNQGNNIYLVEIFNKWIKSDYKSLLEDGLHPNSEGHQKIFETVKDFLIQNEIIPLANLPNTRG